VQEEKTSMPVAVSYPGVYIEEIPSGVRTITGVATSITAFLGRAISGPKDDPTTVFSFADFERQFGGLGIEYPMSYAVADFFRNGGGQAIIVRMFKPKVTGDDGVGHTSFPGDGGLTLDAVSPGTWFNNIYALVDKDNITETIAGEFGLTAADLFNLTIKQVVDGGRSVTLERFAAVHVKDDKTVVKPAGRARRIDRVLQSSQFVSAQIPLKSDGTSQVPTPADGAKSTPASGVSTDPPKKTTTSGTTSPPPSTTPPSTTPPTTSSTTPSTTPSTTQPSSPPLRPGSDSDSLVSGDYAGDQNKSEKKGVFALDNADLFNLLCIPPDARGGNIAPIDYQGAMSYCQTRRAMLIVDPPSEWSANPLTAVKLATSGLDGLGLNGLDARNVALYFPRVTATDQLTGLSDTFVPCGLVAGAMAATDAQRGVWKAPAGLDAGLTGISGLSVKLTNDDNGVLNQIGINCLRTFPIYGNIVWGARTLRGADQIADEYKYIPVRRLALYIEESLFRGTQWVVFEPNDEPLWAQIRLNVGAFMHNLFVKGAFQGQTPAAAYFVKCDKDTTTQNDIDLGIVNIRVGFAPLKPAEFVVLQIQQIAGNIQT
jgi:uncharacterized protein